MALTAGHCWHGTTSGTITSGSAGFFGTLTGQNALFNGTTADARLVETANATTFNWVYWADTLKDRVVGGAHAAYGDIQVGDTVCIRAYVLQPAPCGPVTAVNFSYSFTTPCSCVIHRGVVANYDRAPGNSGGAITSASGFTGVGVHSASDGTGVNGGIFSHVAEVRARLNVTVSTTP